MRCLPALCLALGATQANAQASDTSIDVAIGSSGYALRKTDIGGFVSQTLLFQTRPAHGRLFDTIPQRDVSLSSGGGGQLSTYVASDFSAGVGPVEYRPPITAISVVNGYDSFIFELHVGGSHTTGTVTVNLVANSAPDFGDATAGTRIWPPGTTAPLILPAVTGGNGPITYTVAPALPDGLTFDADTRTISGTPMAESAAAEYTLTATDADRETDTLTFGIDPMRPVRLRLRLFLEGPLR